MTQPVVPLFDANAWGIPFTAAVTGAKQVFRMPLKPLRHERRSGQNDDTGGGEAL